ncbi:ArsR/SmtB family transcription factor [Williamsia sterculiae]|uniref:Transcriptional regulator, ArsR family n=1 Tax=Williamsia sterculiae TaxID=1344003 RepID=A0A1N7H2V8_9NOCA|nr:helix-turn-helix domain-containing protein [Williamsia sterculiae]SIS19177.1 transcriptional regulator, ArsR family [Williamsia sterculiae]
MTGSTHHRVSPRGGDADLAAVAELIGDRARGRILLALSGGRELSASVLAAEAGVSRSTASEHLRRLSDGGLVVARIDGRHRHYRLAGDQVAEALERLIELAPAQQVNSFRGSRRADKLRVARTCYDHIAGHVGVGMMRGMLEYGYLTGGDGRLDPARGGGDRPAAPGNDHDYQLSDAGRDFIADIGIELPVGRRPLVRYCVDWTETRHHLAGRLGRGLYDRALSAGWVDPLPTYRALAVTDRGVQAFAEHFGLVLER